jgi:hypothetical protein
MNRANFNEAIQNTNKEQVLLNILRARDEEPPLFLDVSQVTSSMTFSINLAGGSSYPESANKTFVLNSTAGYSDTPTVTYIPLQGDNLAKSLMSPVSVEAIVALFNSGLRLSELFDLTVERINPQFVNPNQYNEDSKFRRLTTALHTLQQASTLQLSIVKAPEKIVNKSNSALEITETGGGNGLAILIDVSSTHDPAAHAAFEEVKSDLLPNAARSTNLKIKLLFQDENAEEKGNRIQDTTTPNVTDFRAGSLRTRAPLGALRYIAQSAVIVEGDAKAINPSNEYFIIHSSPIASPPVDAYACVLRKGRWYYVSDNPEEWGTRTTFNCLAQILAVQSGSIQNSLLLTLPVTGK